MSNPVVNEFDISQLPRYEKRKFVPQEACLTNKEEVLDLYERLLKRKFSSIQELELWLSDRCELEAAFDQAGTVLYIRMTCQTDDQTRALAYKKFIEEVVPAVKPLEDQLNQKYLKDSKNLSFPNALVGNPGPPTETFGGDSSGISSVRDSSYYTVYDRAIRSDVELFREENVALQTQVALLSQEYQTICGAMTVFFQGEEKTLPQMSKFLLENDRALREEAWRATAERRLKDKDRLEEIFDRMLALRHQTALNAGFQNFCDYQFRAYHRFDYTPQDCKQYHQTVEHFVVPLWKEILQKRKETMRLKELRPWDLAVDASGAPPLKPFSDVNDLISGASEIFRRTDLELGQQFARMTSEGLLDLASRKGKAPGGYQSTLAEIRKPFIFMNAVGIDQDVRTLLHEGGHAFHSLAAASQFLYSYRHAPMEFCEVASMTMELLGGEHLEVFYNENEFKRSRLAHLEDVVEILVWVAIVDCFQSWIYEHPQHTPVERRNVWLAIQKRFSGNIVEWNSLEEIQAYLWHRQLHIFEVPFYYIEYGIAQLGALQLWHRYQENPVDALRYYRQGLAVGGSKPLPEIFETAGIEFDFSQKIIAPLIHALRQEFIRLEKIA